MLSLSLMLSEVENARGSPGPSSPPVPAAMFPFSCPRWLCEAAHFCHCTGTVTTLATQQASCLDTPSSQSLFLRLGSLHHGNHFSWSPPSPGGLRLCPHNATLSMQPGSEARSLHLCCFCGSWPNPKIFFFPAEGCFPLYTGTRESPLTPFSVKHIDFSSPQLCLAVSTAILRSGLPLTSVHLLLISTWVLALAG